MIDHYRYCVKRISFKFLAFAIFTLVSDFARLRWNWLNNICKSTPFIRKSEHDKLTAVPAFYIGVSVSFFFGSKVALYALLFGDTFAAFVGIAIGRHVVVGTKTLEGFLGFVIAVLFCSYESEISLQHAIILGVIGGCAEMYCEIVGVNDNMLIPISVAVFEFIMKK